MSTYQAVSLTTAQWELEVKNPAKVFDLELVIAKCKENHRPSQERLYKHYYSKLFFVAKRYIQDEEDTMEVFNNSMLKVFNNLDTLPDYDRFDFWVKRVVINTALDFLRVRKRLNEYYKPMEETHTRTISADDTNEGYNHEFLISVVESLTPRKQLVFKLFAIEGYSHREIAEQLDITESNSKLILHDARKDLKKKLEKIGFER